MPVELSFTEQGNGPPIIILHGLYGSKRNWTSIAKALSGSYRVFSLDLRNHGDSPWADGMGYEALANDINGFINQHDIKPSIVIGHSMGGKIAMTLALHLPQRVSRLVVVDIAPVARDTKIGKYASIMAHIPLEDCTTRKDVEAHMTQYIPRPQVRQFLLQNLRRKENGFCWRLNLSALEKGMEDIADFPAVPDDTQYAGPTLFVKGATSDYILPYHKQGIKALFPNATIKTIANVGHWVHAEAPEEFLSILSGFLDH